MKPILIVPIATSSTLKKQADKAGYLVISSDEPDKIRLMIPEPSIASGDMLMSAVGAILAGYDSVSVTFVKELFRRMGAREKGVKP